MFAVNISSLLQFLEILISVIISILNTLVQAKHRFSRKDPIYGAAGGGDKSMHWGIVLWEGGWKRL